MENNFSLREVLDSGLPDKTLAAQARLLHVQIPRSLIGGVGVFICFLVVAQDELAWSTLAIWIAIFLISTWFRYSVFLFIKPDIDDDKKVARWAKQLPIMFLLPGLLWGAMASGLVIVSSTESMWFLIAIMAGLCAGAVGALGSIHACYFTYSMGMLIPFALTLFYHQQWLGGTLAVLFGMMNSGFSKNIYRTNLESITTKFENEELVQQMEAQQLVLKDQFAAVNTAMEQADEANRSKSVFLAAASHDLAQPLHSLKLFLVALDSAITTDSQRMLLDRASQCADNMSDLFISLLDISKLDAGIVSVNRQLVDVADVLEPLALEFEAQARENKLGFSGKLKSCVAETDQTILQRIVRNLLHNALKYTNKGQISLEIENGLNNEVFIKVADSGIGIVESEIQHIFTEFYQVGNPERDRTKGLGLGLAIVNRLCKLIDLKIKVVSKAGSGTEFILTLKAADTAALNKTLYATTVDSSAKQEATILFIEDEENTRLAMSIILQNMGHRVIVADSLRTAVSELIESDDSVDLIISDYRLREGETGVDVISGIREECNREIPALIITGDTGAESLRDIQALGVDVIHKLSSQSLITDKITETLLGKNR